MNLCKIIHFGQPNNFAIFCFWYTTALHKDPVLVIAKSELMFSCIKKHVLQSIYNMKKNKIESYVLTYIRKGEGLKKKIIQKVEILVIYH